MNEVTSASRVVTHTSGKVNPLFGFDGGGQQYDLIINGKNVGTFTNERIIGQ